MFDYQLKGAAQLVYACLHSPFKFIMLGDSMGMGKTIQAVLALHKMKHEAGMALVVCPASVVLQWKATIDNLWGLVSLPKSSFSITDNLYGNLGGKSARCKSTDI